MLIKFGQTIVLNISAVERITLSSEEYNEIIEKGGFFKPNKVEKRTQWNVKLDYRDMDGRSNHFTLWYKNNDIDRAKKCRDDLVAQVSELEIEKTTQMLEDAIRKTGSDE